MKTDPKKTLDAYRARHNEFRVVDVPPLSYLIVGPIRRDCEPSSANRSPRQRGREPDARDT